MMADGSLSGHDVGDALPLMDLGRISRHQLALYCGGSGDHNPLHTDVDFARDLGGLPDVIGHGMLTMALAGRILSHYAPPEALRAFTARFVDKTHVGETLRGQAIVERRDDDEVELALHIFADGRLVMTGHGIIAITA